MLQIHMRPILDVKLDKDQHGSSSRREYSEHVTRTQNQDQNLKRCRENHCFTFENNIKENSGHEFK